MNFTKPPADTTGTWRHFKGGLMCVLGTAVHTETEQRLVIYFHIEKDNLRAKLLRWLFRLLAKDLWAREYNNFFEIVEAQGGRVPRFRKLDA